MSPDQFKPAAPADFIGPAAKIAAATLKLVAKLKGNPSANLKLCLYGAPGIGKTELAELAAAALVTDRFDLESVNGRDLTIDKVREWMQGSAYGSLFGGWRVKIVNEMDLVPLAAQDLLLSYLDTLPAGVAIIGTSNQTRDTLSQRFASRFQQLKVEVPTDEHISGWLTRRWKIPAKAANWITLTACGNVREALLQASGFQTFGVLPEAHKTVPVKCASRTDAALRAVATRRANLELVTA